MINDNRTSLCLMNTTVNCLLYGQEQDRIGTAAYRVDLMIRSYQHYAAYTLGAVRFSFSWYNTEEEVMKAVEAVRKLAEYVHLG